MDGPEKNGAGPGATPEPAVNTVAEGANSPGSESITPGATPNQDDAKTALPPAYAAFRAECEAAGMSEAEVLAASRDRKQKAGGRLRSAGMTSPLSSRSAMTTAPIRSSHNAVTR